MAEEYYRGFDYYNAEPPREGAVPPPYEAAYPAPEDEFNENIIVTDIPKRKKTSLGLMLAAGGLAVSFIIPGASATQSDTEITSESTLVETTITESSDPESSSADRSLPTEDIDADLNANIYN